MGDTINKNEFLSLAINELANNPQLREQLFRKLLLGLHNTGSQDYEIITSADETDASTSDVIKQIFNNIDWAMLADQTYGEDTFFNHSSDGLYSSLYHALQEAYVNNNNYKRFDIDEKNWTNHYWNDSMSRLMQLLYQHIDPAGLTVYENSGLLIELIDDDGKIDVDHLRGGIAPDGGETRLAELRVIDIINADAGNSFEPMTELYWYGYFYESAIITFDTQRVELTNVLFLEDAEKIIAAIENGDEISPNDINKLFTLTTNGGYRYSGSVSEYTLPSTMVSATITGTKKKFKICKKPWVIPWYNVDGDTYRRVRGEDMKVSVMTDPNKLGFTQIKDSTYHSKWIRLLMPQYKRRVEVEDLNRNFWVIGQVLTGISAYLFDENGPLMKMLKGLIKEIGQLWENMIFLWTALALLSQKKYYDKTHSEVVLMSLDSLVPYVCFDNFDKANVAAITSQVIANLSYMVQAYPEYNLAVLPCVRLNNYEQNYYSEMWYPGIFTYNRNLTTPQWGFIPFYSSSPNPYFASTGFYFKLIDFSDSIYGIHEGEDTYSYVIPLSNTDDVQPDEEMRYYGIVRDYINFSANISDVINSITVDIKLYDIARRIIANPTEEIPLFIYEGHYSQGSMVVDDCALNNAILLPLEPGTMKIKKGFYQGELLSTCKDVDRIFYDIYVLPTATLKPTEDTRQDIIDHYRDAAYDQMRAEDSTVLESILTNFYDYNVFGSQVFWTQEKEDTFEDSYFHHIESGVEINETRDGATKNLVDTSLVYDDIDDWKTANNNYYAINGNKNLNTTILFIEGMRDTDYVTKNNVDALTKTYFPYGGETTDGFVMPYVESTSVNKASTGAKISLPLKTGRVTSFYDNHTSISSGGPIFATLINWIPKVGGLCQNISDPSILIPAANLPTTLVDDINKSSSHQAGDGNQWLVSIQNGQKTLTNNNWLITKVAYATSFWIKPYNESGGTITSFNNIEKYCRTVSSVGDDKFNMQIARTVAKNAYDTLPSADRTVGNIAAEISTFFTTNNIKNEQGQDYDTEWFYDQAILHGAWDDWYIHQCKVYNDPTKSGEWITRLNTLFNRLSETPTSYSSYGLSDPDGNSFQGRVFIFTELVMDIAVYVFGPNGTYSRRVYGRDADAHYTSQYMRDEETTDGNVDALRQDYVVISNNHNNVNYEKYKSKNHLLIADGGGYYTPSDDDDYFNSYAVIWQDIGTTQPWDIPT